MAIIEGQIEPLKKIKKTLNQNGIDRFSSIREINDFQKNFEYEKSIIPKKVESELDEEIRGLQLNLIQNRKDYDELKQKVIKDIEFEIETLCKQLSELEKQIGKGLIKKFFVSWSLKKNKKKKAHLEDNFSSIVQSSTYHAEKQVRKIEEQLNDINENRPSLLLERSSKALQELENTKEVIDSLYSLIAGAIGENSVIREIQKLPDSFHLFNDFSLEFNPPIYNQKEDDRIYSIQIDHLLVSKAGIFILETKNWGKKSLENIDLRSPVKQIMRSSYALFILLNSRSKSNSIGIEAHHWGRKQIPIKNLIVMTNAKPREAFNHVKIVSLKELNRYVTYFENKFSDEEVENICEYFRRKQA